MKFSFLLLLPIFLLCNPSKAQIKKNKKNQPEKKEKIQVREVMVDSTVENEIALRNNIYQGDVLIKTFDTSEIPNDQRSVNIRILLNEIGAVETALNATTSIIGKQRSAQSGGELDKFYIRFSEALKTEEVNKYYENLFLRLYRKYFTDEEVLQITSFFKTPFGKKFFKTSLLISNDAMIDGSKFGEYLAKKILNDMRKEEK